MRYQKASFFLLYKTGCILSGRVRERGGERCTTITEDRYLFCVWGGCQECDQSIPSSQPGSRVNIPLGLPEYPPSSVCFQTAPLDLMEGIKNLFDPHAQSLCTQLVKLGTKKEMLPKSHCSNSERSPITSNKNCESNSTLLQASIE